MRVVCDRAQAIELPGRSLELPGRGLVAPWAIELPGSWFVVRDRRVLGDRSSSLVGRSSSAIGAPWLELELGDRVLELGDRSSPIGCDRSSALVSVYVIRRFWALRNNVQARKMTNNYETPAAQKRAGSLKTRAYARFHTVNSAQNSFGSTWNIA